MDQVLTGATDVAVARLVGAAPRAHLEAEVERRLRHLSLYDVATTLSYYEMERLLRREYHGRFLIELLQNARDAWLDGVRYKAERGVVLVRLTRTPSLLVCNSGRPMTVDNVLLSQELPRPGQVADHGRRARLGRRRGRPVAQAVAL